MEPKYLGKAFNKAIDELDTIPAKAGLSMVTMTSDELTSVCPMTEVPDYYKATIQFVPDQFCVESKSLKLYLMHFRNEQIFAEHLVVVIRDKVIETIKPKYCKVTLVQKSRGGIVIETVSAWGQAPGNL
ncbi:MAG TPA: preQ(1) synthase [Anaerolineae bacterium]|jgi:7-cyano-7-deazaguanine reductase